ncbi:MAG: hypothetical protein H7332_04265 [Bdellovibrionales bacterium]|nr:hypothetical protein [Ramlibacter sp.]
MPNPTSPAGQAVQDLRIEEAARYALLRRLTPALRHHLIGALQPVGMLAAMLERRAQAAQPDMPGIQKKCADLGQLSREATASCVDLISWISPKTADSVSAEDGIKECLSVLETDLALRGFSTVNKSAGQTCTLARSAVRNVLTAALLALTDSVQSPHEVVLSAGTEGDLVVLSLTLTLKPREGEPMAIANHAYRAMEWDDVLALARSESVEVEYSALRVKLVCPPGPESE